MSDFLNYMHAQAERREAYEGYNYASKKLDLAWIHERLAEIKSQHEPLASLLAAPLSERERLYAAAYYVVVGRPYHPGEAAGDPAPAGSGKEEG